jgi:exopolysaccharide biosynthesis polyprenyl glycosylphosphotransferase
VSELGGTADAVGAVPATRMLSSASHVARHYQVAPSQRRSRLLLQPALISGDITALAVAFVVAALYGPTLRSVPSLLGFAFALALWVAVARACGLYELDDRRPGHTTLDELVPLAQLLTAGAWGGLLASWTLAGHPDTKGVVVFWAASTVLVPAGRSAVRAVVRRHPGYPQRTVVVGAGEVGQLVARKLIQHPEWRLHLLGFVDSRPRPIRRELMDVPVLGTPRDLVDILSTNAVERVLVAFSDEPHEELVEIMRSARGLGVHVDVVPRLFDTIGPVGDVNHIEGLPLVSLYRSGQSRPARWAKRVLDFTVAASLLFLVWPLFAWIAWRIKRDSPGPVFFRQVRLGEHQTRFTLLKFRTMAPSADDAPHREYVRQIMHPGASPTSNGLYKLDRSAEVTAFGRWLRHTSLDELPQLLNVLRGEMSLVGPRPCLAYETDLFEPHHFDRFLVPAGMTGLWQVTARARATLKEALDLDAAYARNWSLRLDLWLLARTPFTLLRGGSTT